jgi:hypothetical protein
MELILSILILAGKKKPVNGFAIGLSALLRNLFTAR